MGKLFSQESYDSSDQTGKDAAISYFEKLGFSLLPKTEDRGIDLIFTHPVIGEIYVDAAVRYYFDFPLLNIEKERPYWRGIIHILERKQKYEVWYPGRGFVFELSADLSEGFLFNCNVLTPDKLVLSYNKRYQSDGELMYYVHYSRAKYCKI